MKIKKDRTPRRRLIESEQSKSISISPLILICKRMILSGKRWKPTLISIARWVKRWEGSRCRERLTKMMNLVPWFSTMAPRRARRRTWPRYCRRWTRNQNRPRIKQEAKASSTACPKMVKSEPSSTSLLELKRWMLSNSTPNKDHRSLTLARSREILYFSNSKTTPATWTAARWRSTSTTANWSTWTQNEMKSWISTTTETMPDQKCMNIFLTYKIISKFLIKSKSSINECFKINS